ncbi:hypothetical protein GOP47_0024772 [Adiantum capillus-veneris]|uniref:Uncharacterized protein n=1 Tax=Adiantum capillus-veneris TaxID=13818 RepID=A0A9D4Z4N1_ADICA|nr:hypothetical protein GOP47_0024772 [Adiantum capillus-veneris]
MTDGHKRIFFCPFRKVVPHMICTSMLMILMPMETNERIYGIKCPPPLFLGFLNWLLFSIQKFSFSRFETLCYFDLDQFLFTLALLDYILQRHGKWDQRPLSI